MNIDLEVKHVCVLAEFLEIIGQNNDADADSFAFDAILLEEDLEVLTSLEVGLFIRKIVPSKLPIFLLRTPSSLAFVTSDSDEADEMTSTSKLVFYAKIFTALLTAPVDVAVVFECIQAAGNRRETLLAPPATSEEDQQLKLLLEECHIVHNQRFDDAEKGLIQFLEKQERGKSEFYAAHSKRAETQSYANNRGSGSSDDTRAFTPSPLLATMSFAQDVSLNVSRVTSGSIQSNNRVSNHKEMTNDTVDKWIAQGLSSPLTPTLSWSTADSIPFYSSRRKKYRTLDSPIDTKAFCSYHAKVNAASDHSSCVTTSCAEEEVDSWIKHFVDLLSPSPAVHAQGRAAPHTSALPAPF